MNDHIGLLETFGIFRGLPKDVIGELAALAVTRTVGRNQTLFQKGDEADGLYCVLSGRVRISVQSESGKEIILNIMQPGEVFGEIALMDGTVRSADASGQEQAELLLIRRRDFMGLVDRSSVLARHMIALLCRRIRWISSQVEDTAFLALSARLAKRLLLMREVVDPIEGKITIQVSQSELGQMTGVSREAVNKVLQHWRRQGWIELGKGRISLSDEGALQEVAETPVD